MVNMDLPNQGLAKTVHFHQSYITKDSQVNNLHRRGRKTVTNMRGQETIKLKR
jgi:hypothetical protein